MSRPKFKPLVYETKKENNFVTKISTNTTDEIPNVVFLLSKVRVTPLLQNKLYMEDILSLKATFDVFARNLLDSCYEYDKNYIFNIDIAEKSVRYKKTSHLRYEVYLRPKNKLSLLDNRDKLMVISDKLEEKLIDLFKKYNLNWF